MKKGLLVAVLPLVLGGCLPILPPAIQLASTGLSGLAFLATGKSTTDHILSAAVDEDCSLLRVAFGENPCHEYEGDDQKPLTEIVAYYPGDGDDWMDRGSIPKGSVSGKTILTAFTDDDPDVRSRSPWPGIREAETILVEKPADHDGTASVPANVSAGLDAAKDLKVTGFAPVRTPFEPEPIKLTSAPVDVAVLPAVSGASWAAEPARAEPTAAPEQAVEISERGMVLPVLRPRVERRGFVTDDARSEAFSEAGLAATEWSIGEAVARPRLMQDMFASTQGAVVPAPVVMSVHLKGNLLSRFAGGTFGTLDVSSALEPVIDTHR